MIQCDRCARYVPRLLPLESGHHVCAACCFAISDEHSMGVVIPPSQWPVDENINRVLAAQDEPVDDE